MWQDLLGGFTAVLEPMHLLVLCSAILIGFLGGALPGISGTMLVIILLPITYGMDTISAFLMLTAIYAAVNFSGAISAIMFRTPGTPEAIATVFDGYPMKKQGKGGQALGVAIFSSAIGGVIGALILIFLTPALASFALNFSSPELFALAVLGLTVVASLSGGNLIKGILGVSFGLFIATIGMDALSGAPRFHFGNSNLMTGVELLAVLIGLFSIPEILQRSKEDHSIKQTMEKVKTKIFDLAIFKKISATIGRSSILGTFIGILPGVGATTAAMLSYSEEVRWSKHPEKFGTGIPEGIAAPETANNSAAMGALVPLFALGIPGSATTAVILGAFILHGLQPGPTLMASEGELVYAVFAGLLLVNLMALVFAKPFIQAFSKLMNVPYTIMGPIILILCVIGVYSVRNSFFDIGVMVLFGIIGYWFEKIKFPVATVVLGVVLGPIAENEFRRALQMTGGDYSVFFTRPISAVLLAIAIFVILAPIVSKFIKAKRLNRENPSQGVTE